MRNAAGAPVADVRVHGVHRLARSTDAPLQFSTPPDPCRFSVSPTTDRDGKTLAVVRHDPHLWWVNAPGRVAVAAKSVLQLSALSRLLRPNDSEQVRATPPPSPFQGSLDLILRPTPTLQVVFRSGDAPISGLGVTAAVLCAMHPDPDAPDHTAFGELRLDAATDRNGVAAFASLPAGQLQLSIDDYLDISTAILPRAGLPAAPMHLDLDQWPVLDWQVAGVAPDGLRPRLLLLPAQVTEHEAVPVVIVVDRSHCCRVRMEPGDWLVIATDGRGFVARMMTITKAAPAETTHLKLAPLARFAGRVVDAGGEPAAGVLVCTSYTTDRGPPEGAAVLDRLLHEHRRVLDSGLTPRTQTDADGRFELFYLPLAGITRECKAAPDLPSVPLTPRTDVEFRLRR